MTRAPATAATVRPMLPADAPDVLALLHWMDAAPEREVFAPDARDVPELCQECEGSRCFITEGADGVSAYAALSPFRDGLVLEGPLGEDPAALRALITRALASADGLPVYAFCARDNLSVRQALEAAGLTPMHSTAFYTAPLEALRGGPGPAGDCAVDTRLTLTEYRALYRAAEDTWADRLDWTPEQFSAHFAQPDVKLLVLRRGGQPVAFAELERRSEDARADMPYLAVHPAERRRGHSRALLALAAQEAARWPEVRSLRTRAHDHLHAARSLYAHAGMTHCRSVVTYLRETEEEA